LQALELAASWSSEWSEAVWEHGLALGIWGDEQGAYALLERAVALEPRPARREEMRATLHEIRAYPG
jgi:hypothetical protein